MRDPRLKILLAAAAGLLVWRAEPVGLVVYLLAVGALLLRLERGGRSASAGVARRGLSRAALFAGGWALARGGVAVWEGGEDAVWTEAAHTAGVLGLRLLVLMSVGFLLAASGSARELARGAAGLLRPVLGAAAWRPALSLALMVHFLPAAVRVGERTRLAMRSRQVAGGVWTRWRLTAAAWVVGLAREADAQAMAVTARGLDRPEAWAWPEPFRWREWVAAGAAVLAMSGLSALG